MNNDHLLDGNTSALNHYQSNEILEEHRYEGFEYELEQRMNNDIQLKEGIALIENAFTEWLDFCEDEGYERDQVPMLKEFAEGFLKMTGDTL